MKKLILALIIAVLAASVSANNLYFARLKYEGGNWDSENLAWGELAEYLVSITNIRAVKEPVPVAITDDRLFEHPVVFMTGDSAFHEWKPEEVSRLRRYFDAGGIMIIDDSTGLPDSAFAKSVRREISRVFPEGGLEKIKTSSAVFMSFFLMPKVCGTRQSEPHLFGVERAGQLAVIFSVNDLFGAWEKDKLGNWLKDCRPGGEAQRFEAQKLSVNVIMYAMVGTYKLDAVHTDYIRKKMDLLNMRPPGQAK